MNIRAELLKKQDIKYREFTIKLNPTLDPNTIIGVRNPDARSLAKEAFKEGGYQTFLDSLPHKYFEENNVHSFIIEQIKDYDKCIEELNKFLPYVDNWATCDALTPKVFKKHKEELIKEIKKWLKSKETYTIRFGIEMLMAFYLDEDFDEKHLGLVSKVKSNEYYVNMMRAWYFATALAKQSDATIKIIENKSLDVWTHNKTIQKAIESYRISDEDKEYLRTLKVK